MTGRKLLLASVGVATASFIGCEEQTSGNLIAPPCDIANPDPNFCPTDTSSSSSSGGGQGGAGGTAGGGGQGGAAGQGGAGGAGGAGGQGGGK